VKTLNPLQQQTLRAIVDCLIPPDDYPGAYEAGVCDYLERLYQTDLASQLEFCAAGLDSIDTESRFRFEAAFPDLNSDQQSSILEAIETGNVFTPWPLSPTQFFNLLVTTTAEGYYSDPQQGGNRGSISWEMTGFEEPTT
jgi:gluconate 2-dehydrogenase gamma chain